MRFVFKHIFNFILLLIVLIISNGCKLQEPYKNHGILFLENRFEKLVINSSNKNDVLKTIGQPHSKSIDNENEWFYIERVLTKGAYHKLGKNILKSNNVLVLSFDKYGILNNKIILNKNDKKELSFSTDKTANEITQKSFVEKFLSSVRTKMYKNR
tara:strand:+ start:9488 stop:9955 length:468 start_codon:yes stop_codon:yes gene_type:complete